MAESTYEQNLFFNKRIRVEADTVIAIQANLTSLGLIFVSCRLAGAGFEHRYNLEEVNGLSSVELAQADRIGIRYKAQDADVVISFVRVGYSYLYRTQINIESPSRDYVFKVLGLRAMLESRFEDQDELSPDRFTAVANTEGPFKDSPLEEPPLAAAANKTSKTQSGALIAPIESSPLLLTSAEQLTSTLPSSLVHNSADLSSDKASSESRNQKHKSKAPSVVVLLTLLISGMGITIYFWQGRSAEHQALTQDKQYAIEGGATFRAEALPSDQGTSGKANAVLSFDYRVQNIGRTAAANVRLRCGPATEHGPVAELGTIPANSPKDVHALLYPASPLHTKDIYCAPGAIYLVYDDLNGHHIISFDKVGNVVPQPLTEDE